MEEETKTKTTKKSSTTKKGAATASSKKTTTKSSTAKKTTTTAASKTTSKTKTTASPKTTTSKSGSKTKITKSTTKKTSSPTATPKKVTSTAKKSSKKETPEQILEHTIIFDGLEKENTTEPVATLAKENNDDKELDIKRSKANKFIVILLYILITVIILTTAVYVINNQITGRKPKETINSNVHNKVSENYHKDSDIKSDKNVDKTTYSNIENIGLGSFEKMAYNKEDAHILVASSTCYYCAVFEDTVNEAYKDSNKKIYRIDINHLTSNEINTFRTYYAFTDTPTIFSIKDGVVTAELVGTTSKEKLIEWIQENK